MSAEDPSTTDAHSDALADLAWYVNGTLDDDAASRVEAHVAQCAACREELAALTALADRMRTADVVEPSPRVALADVLERIDAFETRRARRRAWAARLGEWLDRVKGIGLPAAVGVQAIVILALVMRPLAPPLDATDSLPRYRTLTETDAAMGPRARARLVFADDTTVAEMRALLDRIGAEVIAGPNSSGALVIEFEPLVTNPDELERRLAVARAGNGVVFADVIATPDDSGGRPRVP